MGKFTSTTFVLLVGALSLSYCRKADGVSPETKAAISRIQVKPITPEDVFKLAQKSKAKLTLVNFWASWCGPCRQEFPDLLKLRVTLASKSVAFEFLSVDFGDDLSDVKTFLAEKGVDFVTYIKTGDDKKFIAAIDKTWPAALPSTFIFDSQGKILHRFDGPVPVPVMETKILELLK